MKILAIETTDKAGSVALLDGRRIVVEERLAANQRSAQSLAPAMQNLLELARWQPAEVRLAAVALGPGSFTGLRVGVTTAKIFAYAVGCDLVAVPTLEVIAAQAIAAQAPDDLAAQGSPPSITAVLDAGRQQVFSARFRSFADGRVECIEPTELLDDDVWLAASQARLSRGEVFTGPGLRKFGARMPAGAKLAPAESWAPKASTVGLLALGRFEAGQRDDPRRLVPLYHRASAAEESRG